MRGNLHERKDRPGYFQASVYAGRKPNGRPHYVTRGIRGTKSQAETVLNELLSEVAKGRHRSDTGTVGALLRDWLEASEDDLSPSTLRNYRGIVRRYLEPELAKVAVPKLNVLTLERLYDRQRRTGLAPATIRQTNAVMRRALQDAVRWGWIDRNPASVAKLPRMAKPALVVPRREAVMAVIDKARTEAPWLAVFLWLAAATGARRGELCALRWSAVGEDSLLISESIVGLEGGGWLAKGTKTHAARRIGLDVATTAVLTAHRGDQEALAALGEIPLAADPYLFSPVVSASRPWMPDSVTHVLARVSKSAGVKVTALDLRHFSVTELLTAGVDVRTVAGRHGHSNASTTLGVYAGWVRAADASAAKTMGALLAGP